MQQQPKHPTNQLTLITIITKFYHPSFPAVTCSLLHCSQHPLPLLQEINKVTFAKLQTSTKHNIICFLITTNFSKQIFTTSAEIFALFHEAATNLSPSILSA